MAKWQGENVAVVEKRVGAAPNYPSCGTTFTACCGNETATRNSCSLRELAGNFCTGYGGGPQMKSRNTHTNKRPP